MQLTANYSKKIYAEHPAPVLATKKEAINDYIKNLPFKLTDDQTKTTEQILGDIEKSKPIHRLIQGDVGSGKTVVASIAILNAALNGYQCALMAPTELLAIQHYDELKKLFKNQPVRLGLATSKQVFLGDERVSKASLAVHLKQRDIDCVVGTHALIQDTIALRNVGLIIVDEQHRFGVVQRKRLTEKGLSSTMPHLISLTATPIPRTLALTLYGDLEISTIKQKPVGRKPITTRIVSEDNRQKAYDFIRGKITSGQQAFVLCPLIDESDVSESKSVVQEYEHLQKNIFPGLEIRFVHGKMKSDDKKKILEDFKNNTFSILVTTSVIEVGIDIPQATIMVIEGAERFGLAQLHQFRGRVGRNTMQSYCLLFSQNASSQTQERLQLFATHQDGFELAEADLRIRGEGELFGTKQSGMANFKVATIHDTDLIQRSKKWVDRILSPEGLPLYKKIYRTLEEKGLVHLE